MPISMSRVIALGASFVCRVDSTRCPVSAEIERLAVERAPANAVQAVALREGMLDLRTDGLRKAMEGQTSIPEVVRVAV
jgi:type II secretory ATPase GspE/PulE/Tfp pilus assembly ATPase PilB-like protein